MSTAAGAAPSTRKDSSGPKGDDGEAERAAKLVELLRLPQATNRQLFRWIFSFTRPVRSYVILAITWLVVWMVAEMFTVRQAGEVINYIKKIGQDASARTMFDLLFRSPLRAVAPGLSHWVFSADPRAHQLLAVIGMMGFLVLIYVLTRYMRIVADTKLSMNIVYYIREAVYDKLQRVGFGFHDVLSTGQLINRALSDLQNVRQFIQTAILTTLEIILAVLFYIALIWTRNHWLAGLALLPLPIWVFYILRFSKRIQPAAKSVMEAEDKNVSIITENIAGVHVVKAFATEKVEIEKYGANSDLFKDRVLKRIRMFADFNPVIRAIATASHLSLFAAAGVLTIRGKLGPGDFMILGGAMGAILGRLQAVATLNEQYQNAIVSSRRLYEVLLAPATVPEKPSALALPAGPGEVVFENVTFGYDPEKPVLEDVSFRAKGASIVAIVGPTGAGKTTLVNLIARFYDPQRGRILLDGVDLRDVTLASLRTQVAFVFQETYLFSDTVSANVAYGRPNISHGEIEAAARLAQAHEFIEQLPKVYDTVLTERGSSLSGGQKQRLAIARAIVTNPRVLILDDATAAIDPETEELIRKAMHFVMYGRTTFIIAHRISTVKRADLVVVLEHGRVSQLGTHVQLMQQAGHYRDIAVAQLYGDDDQPPPPQGEHPSHMKRLRDELGLANASDAVEKNEGPESMGK